MKNIVTIDSRVQDKSRPNERPPKSNWRTEMVRKGLSMLQHITTSKTAEVIWYYFTQPGKVKFTDPQRELIDKAEIFTSSYHGDLIYHYRWGKEGPKVLLSHGWRSKSADFRRMIEALLLAGYVVESIDMKAHGQSEGKHTALPEFRDILKEHYTQHGPYEAMIGYSLGGLAAGLVASELAVGFQPKKLILIAAPPYVRYFFKDIITELGFKDEVYNSFCKLVEKNYQQSVDYFDLRIKLTQLETIDLQLIYDENDETVSFTKGKELYEAYPESQFVHSKGLGHYKIISSKEIIDHTVAAIETETDHKNLNEVKAS